MWKEYPENKPKENGRYLCKLITYERSDDQYEVLHYGPYQAYEYRIVDGEKLLVRVPRLDFESPSWEAEVVAWMEVPK